MKLKSRVLGSVVTLLTSTGTYAACPPGTSPSTDGKDLCLPNAGIVVVTDPDWLVASLVVIIVLLVLVLAAALYTAMRVNGLADRVKGKRFDG